MKFCKYPHRIRFPSISTSNHVYLRRYSTGTVTTPILHNYHTQSSIFLPTYSVLSTLSTPISATVYTALLGARMAVSPVSVVLVGLRQHDRRRDRLRRPLVFAGRPVRRRTHRLLSRWRRGSRRFLGPTTVVVRWRRLPDIS